MHLYRVDKRCFNKDEIIRPRTTFEENMNGLQLEVEKILDNLRPSKVPARKDCLYLFYNLSSALLFSSKYGGYIYEVSLEQGDCYWRADMNMLDNIYTIFKISQCEKTRTDVVHKYWEEGAHTFQPCYELLVRQAKVVRVVIDEENSKELIKKEITACGTIENSPMYMSILKETLK